MSARLHERPAVGLLGLAVGFLTQPLGHTAFMLNEGLSGRAAPLVAAMLGILGFILVWRGLKREELAATWLGMLGGWLVWVGWFEESFAFFAHFYSVPAHPVEPGVAGGYVATPSANLLQATLPLMLALFILYGMFNLQTRCNLMRWLHRRLHFSPGQPTPDNRRSFARITAMEVLFVTWFCYLFWLYAIWAGTRGTGALLVTALFVAWTAWAVYLAYRCTLQVRTAPALRYGIGAGIVLWGSVEMPAHFGAWREYWLHPFEYPVFNALEACAFLIGVTLVARRPRAPGTRLARPPSPHVAQR